MRLYDHHLHYLHDLHYCRPSHTPPKSSTWHFLKKGKNKLREWLVRFVSFKPTSLVFFSFFFPQFFHFFPNFGGHVSHFCVLRLCEGGRPQGRGKTQPKARIVLFSVKIAFGTAGATSDDDLVHHCCPKSAGLSVPGQVGKAGCKY